MMGQQIKLPRYGLRWNGPKNFIPAEMPDGYWTPWHIANETVLALQNEVEVQAYWGPKWEAEYKEVLQLRKMLDEAIDFLDGGSRAYLLDKWAKSDKGPGVNDE